MTVTTEQTPALWVKSARKTYKNLVALKNLDLEVGPGEFFGLLGPNGAGKTTLIRSVVGLNQLDSGDIRIFGHDIKKDYQNAKRLIGYSPQEVNLERFFSIEKTIAYQAGYYGLTRAQALAKSKSILEQLGLTEKANNAFIKLSGGMQKRAVIAKALVSDPKLLILDEPTAGVDVEQRHDLWAYLRKINNQGTSIILTTHYIDEAEALCGRIAVINAGEIIELDSPQNLITRYCSTKVVITTNKDLKNHTLPTDLDFEIKVSGKQITAIGKRAGMMTEKLLASLMIDQSLTIEDISVCKGSLEDVFLKLTGKSLKEIESEAKKS